MHFSYIESIKIITNLITLNTFSSVVAIGHTDTSKIAVDHYNLYAHILLMVIY